MRLLSQSLSGKNSLKNFIILCGKGDNGKTTFINLILITFGNYAKSLKTSILDKTKVNSSSAFPELMEMKGARISIIHEGNSDNIISGNTVKILKGNDPITGRN